MTEAMPIIAFIVGLLVVIGYVILGHFRPAIALLTCPVTIAVLIALPEFYDSDDQFLRFVSLVVSPAVFLGTLLAILTHRTPPGEGSWAKATAKVLLTILGTSLVLGGCFALSGPMGIYGLMLVLALTAAIIRYSLSSRQSTAVHVFSTLAACMRQNLPLATALEAEAGSLQGKGQRILHRISWWLTQGFSLSESIRRGFPWCPGDALAMVAAAEPINQLPVALARVEANLEHRGQQAQKLQPVHPLYLLAVVAFTCVVASGVMVFVIPSFETILDDMGAKVPAITRAMISTGRAFRGGISLLVGLLMFGLIPLVIYTKFRARRPAKPYVLSRVGDFLKWRLPVLHWFERNYSLLQTVSFLRLSLAAGATVDQAIAGAAELDVNICYRRKLARWLEAVRRGEGISVSARAVGAGASLAWAFDQPGDGSGVPKALEMIESVYQSNYGYAMHLARFIFWPCVTISMGLMVGCFVLAMFLPLIAILNTAMQGIIP